MDRALENFYEDAVVGVALETGMEEAQIRRWFGEKLIDPSRIRTQVIRTRKAAGGLATRAVDLLLNEHLIRSERVRGARWIELVHDRLIDPILASNEKALVVHPVSVDARNWQRAGRDPSFLYPGQKLAETIEWANANRGAVGRLEQEFLAEASKAEEQASGVGCLCSAEIPASGRGPGNRPHRHGGVLP